MQFYKLDGTPAHALPLIKTKDKRFLKKAQLLQYMHRLNLSTRRLGRLIKRPYRTVQGWMSPQKAEGGYIPISIAEWRKIVNLEFIKNTVESGEMQDKDIADRTSTKRAWFFRHVDNQNCNFPRKQGYHPKAD